MKTECVVVKEGRWRRIPKQLKADVEGGLIMGLPSSALV
jgi:hypothetical protein